MSSKVVMAYVPVIHSGYIKFFQNNRWGSCPADCFVFGKEVIRFVDKKLDYLRKEIRAISPEEAVWALSAIGGQFKLIGLKACQRIADNHLEVVLPEDDVSHVLAERFFRANKVIYDNVFLRWNRNNVNAERLIVPDQTIPVVDFDREMMSRAVAEATRSSDWWRKVGAEAIRPNGQVLFSRHNRHLPSPNTPYIDGDPRNTTKRGEGLDLYTSLHAEASIIASAAKDGVSLKGAYLYVSTFPCPPCAKLIASAGFSRLYYGDGYAVLDGEDDLRQKGVEIIKVDLPPAP